MPKSSEQLNPYPMEEAENEAAKMQEKIKSGEAENYSEAEKTIENEAKVKNLQEALMHPTIKNWGSGYRTHDSTSIKSPEVLMSLWVDYGYIYICKEEIDNGVNALIKGGEIYSSLGNHDFSDGKKPEYKETQSDPEKEQLIQEAFNRKLSNAIRIEKGGGEAFNSEAVEDKLKEYLSSGKSIIDALKDLEKQNFLKICHIPGFYTDKEALKDRYSVEFSTRKEMDKFLESEVGKSADPRKILERAKYLDGDTIKFLLEKYQDKIDLAEVISFGPGSFIQNLDRNDKMAILEKVVSILEKKTDDSIENLGKWKENWYKQPAVSRYGQFEPGLTKESDLNMESRLNILISAAASGLILPDHKERIKKINSVINYIPSGYYSGRVISRMREDIEEVALLLEELSNEKKITGKGAGLEFVNSEYTQSKQVYLDGELIGGFDNAEFSENPTNGEIVAWVTHEVIDRDRIAGTQNRDIVYAWKKGTGGPIQLFEDHAWSNERYLRVFAPEVESDGTIKVEIKSGDKIEKKEFKM
ncbi:MAG: hypothetical protein ACD_7C00576G0001 [uncultured bacterium]|nr:MAG: hypothetical protein ACD_7C00576G0001 [uncultured bacterium]